MIKYMFREYIANEEVINFYANGLKLYHILSNFHWIKEGVKDKNGLEYPSTEHLFQSYKYIDEDKKRFTVNGDLGNVDGFKLVFSEKDYEKKT